jgi:uncharacterized membrane protein YeiB
MLFGIGFAIYLAKAEENNKVLRLFKRRLFFFSAFGTIQSYF